MTDYKVIRLGELLNIFEEQVIQKAFEKFSCKQEIDIEEFLKYKSILYEKSNIGKTNLIIDEKELQEGNFVILAYFTIAQKSVDISELSQTQRQKALGSYPGRDTITHIPVYLIGQLGRCDSCEKESLTGAILLKECYSAIMNAMKIVGGRMIVLECREQMFGKFYSKHGFKKLYKELGRDNLYTLYKRI